MDEGERTKECSYYGVDYRLSVHYSPDHFSIAAEERQTGVIWRGDFSSSYIEELTVKTGNFKRFSVFVKMLLAALEGSSHSVVLEVLPQQQMEVIRARKRGSRGSAAGDAKTYVILTYIVEFDKVHYPLPLAQEELTLAQQSLIIRRLRAQVEGLKRLIPPNNVSLIDLVSENARLREELAQLKESLQGAKASSELDSHKQLSIMQSLSTELRAELSKSRSSLEAAISAKDSQETLRQTIEDLCAELQTTKCEMQWYRQMLEARETSSVRTTQSRPVSSRYAQSPVVEEELAQSERAVHHEEGQLAASAGEDIDSRMRRVKELLTKHAVL